MLRSAGSITFLAGLLTAMITGCAEEANNVDPAAPAADASNPAADPEIEKALAELSPEDRKLAEQQKICPVSKEPLGSMGKPIQVEVDGRTVFVCCAGCVDVVKNNPDEYLQNI